MGTFSPTSRRKYEIDEPTLNLNPMMDMMGVLIPAVLFMSAAVEVAVARVAAPSIDGGESTPPPPADTPPLNLMVTISDGGFEISGTDPEVHVKLPVVERKTLCSRFRGTWPPPRNKNRNRPKCDPDRPREQMSFFVYDREGLNRKIIEIKDKYPHEFRVIIAPTPEVEYETIVDAMDSARDIMLPSGEVRMLFNEVVLSPGTAQM